MRRQIYKEGWAEKHEVLLTGVAIFVVTAVMICILVGINAREDRCKAKGGVPVEGHCISKQAVIE